MPTDPKASRGSSRFQAGLPSILTVNGRTYVCDAHNLSRSGVLLTGDLPSAEGHVRIQVSSCHGDLEIDVQGLVRRYAAADDAGPAQLGLHFEDLSDETVDTLNRIIARVVEGLTPAPLEALPPHPAPELVRAALEKITLAHRMNLATRGDIGDRELLMLDRNLRVIDALARNPRLTQPEVQVLLRRRPLLPSTLDALARDARWTSNTQMAVAIASHPSVQLQLAERIARGLREPQRRDLLSKSGLHPTLREKLVNKKL